MTIDVTKTVFRDIAEREASARERLRDTRDRLLNVKKKRELGQAERAELELTKSILDTVKNNAAEVCEPLFVATRTLLNEKSLIFPKLLSVKAGRLVFGSASAAPPPPPPKGRAAAAAAVAGAPPVTLVALTIGLLAADAAEPPPVKVRSKGGVDEIYPNLEHRNSAAFTRAFYAAIGEAQSFGDLAGRVHLILAEEGDPDGRGSIDSTVKAEEFARVMRGLAKLRDVDRDPQLRRRVNEVLNVVQHVGGQDRIADLSIDLPDLDEIFDQNIVAENVRAMGPMIVAAMFDELKVFQVVDRIVDQFQQGTLPIGPGNAGRLLYRYWREAPNRLSEQERRNFACTTLGIPGGDPGAMVNREFNDLWLRFVSSVSSFVRQHEVDSLLRSALPSPISHQQVRKSARDLAANLSLHGYGMAHYAARELQDQIGFMIDLLQDPEIRGAFGARDMWQVVDQVATYDLGGARTSSRYRTLATCGTIITAWLANNVNRINRATGALIDINQIRNPDIAADHKATRNPTDYDLVNACELWLADTATSDSQVEEMAQPREAPQMTSKPIPIPALARDMLEGLGDLGVGLGRGQPARAGNGSGSYTRQ